jgi:hypothetical protein
MSRHSRANTSRVQLADGREVCYSYREPVAAFLPEPVRLQCGDLVRGYVRRAHHFSPTSSRHANDYAGRFSPYLQDAEFLAAIAPLTRQA